MTGEEELFAKKPLYPIVKELKAIFKHPKTGKKVRKTFKRAIDNVKDFPDDPPLEAKENIWRDRSYMEFCYYFNNWFHFLATPSKAGLGFISPFTEFYYNFSFR